jgi:hypothetical protein
MSNIRQWLVAPVAAVTLLSTAACTLPPYTVNGTPFTVKYSMFIPAEFQGVPLISGVPAFDDKPAPASTIAVPQEAKSFKLTALDLILTMSNTGPLPLRTKIYLGRPSDADVYKTTPLGGDQASIDLPRGGATVTKTLPLDPSLLQEVNLKLGYTFGSPGTKESVTFKPDDSVTIGYSIRATAKLF